MKSYPSELRLSTTEMDRVFRWDSDELEKFKGIVGENSNELRLSSIPKSLYPVATLYYNKDGYTTHCKDWKSYQTWLNERNLNRFHTNVSHGHPTIVITSTGFPPAFYKALLGFCRRDNRHIKGYFVPLTRCGGFKLSNAHLSINSC